MFTGVHWDPLEVWYAPGQHKVSGGPLGFHQKRKYIPEYAKVSGIRILQLFFDIWHNYWKYVTPKNIKLKKFKILRSLRFEHFLSLLKNSEFIIGNSSSAIYEAPMFNLPAINIGDRQHKRTKSKLIKNVEIDNLNEITINKFLNNF